MKSTGTVVGAQGNLVTALFEGTVIQNEVAFVHVSGADLKGEVIEIDGSRAKIQVFEMTRGISLGDKVTFEGALLSVELGPGLLKGVVDGLQNPLEQLAEKTGFFLQRGVYLPPLDRQVQWDFTPTVKPGDVVSAGTPVGAVPEGPVQHKILAPFRIQGKWTVTEIAAAGKYTVEKIVAKIRDASGKTQEIRMFQTWPAKIPLRIGRRLLPNEPLATQCRVIDGPFPVCRGGTFCIPGPFGAGKTVLQHQLAKYAKIQVVIIVACGERAGEVVEILREFPELPDPQTGRKLIDRTCIICNTSSMPVAARESSVYIGVTIAEYYRQMGIDCLLLADSTSRWAQALREMSGRLEEIPGEEAFPAYLASRIAELYERAGVLELGDGQTGSLTIGGSVSPAGGNFEEPVTQSTLAVVGCFLGLSRARSDARRFPAIDPLISWSTYLDRIAEHGDDETKRRTAVTRKALSVLRRSDEISKKMAVVGEEGTSLEDMIVFFKGEFYDAVFLQQNAFDPVDTATNEDRVGEQMAIVDQVMDLQRAFPGRDEARAFFTDVTNLFIQWNFSPATDPSYERSKGALAERLNRTN